MEDYAIGYDVGGTRLKVGIVDAHGMLKETFAVPSRANEGAQQLFDTIVEFTEKQIAEKGRPTGIGLSLSGGVDPEKGVVLLPGKFKNLEGFPIVPMLREKFNIPVICNNDGRLAMYAAKHGGYAEDVDWAVVLTIGTGIGSGVMINGNIDEDPHFQFGTQIGHMVMQQSSQSLCLTGNYGTCETLCSATALALMARETIQRGVPSILEDQYFSNPHSIDFKAVVDAVRAGDQLCIDVFEQWIENVAVMLINTVHAYEPQRIILSGGATLAADLFIDKLRTKVSERIFRFPSGTIDIVVAKHQEYAGVVGAVAYLQAYLQKQAAAV